MFNAVPVGRICWKNIYSQLGVDGLLLHDLHDGPAGVGRTFRRGVNCDGLLCRACVFFPVDVDPGAEKKPLVTNLSASRQILWMKGFTEVTSVEETLGKRPVTRLRKHLDQAGAAISRQNVSSYKITYKINFGDELICTPIHRGVKV